MLPILSSVADGSIVRFIISWRAHKQESGKVCELIFLKIAKLLGFSNISDISKNWFWAYFTVQNMNSREENENFAPYYHYQQDINKHVGIVKMCKDKKLHVWRNLSKILNSTPSKRSGKKLN